MNEASSVNVMGSKELWPSGKKENRMCLKLLEEREFLDSKYLSESNLLRGQN